MVERGEAITGITPTGAFGVGLVHTVNDETFFVQLRVQNGPASNHYFRHDDEGVTWVRGDEPDETTVAAMLATNKLIGT